MAILNVNSDGNAPSTAKVGDVIKTGGGNFQIVNPGTPGAGYNPSSGFWSVKVGDAVNNSASILSQASRIASNNSAISQASADKQMQYQTEANAKAMSFSAEEAQKNRDWQERMSNTAHQREVKDLLAAGLNPVLSAMGGSGASTPSGASASGVSSSGAQAQVDMSQLGAIATIANALINQKTSTEVAKINADATINASAINAKSAERVQSMKETQEEYMSKFYPKGISGLVSSVVNFAVDALGGTNNAKAEARFERLRKALNPSGSK